jgi:hypothetical protein
MKFKDFSRTFKDLFQYIQGPGHLATGKIFENHLTFILKLKERNAIRK